MMYSLIQCCSKTVMRIIYASCLFLATGICIPSEKCQWTLCVNRNSCETLSHINNHQTNWQWNTDFWWSKRTNRGGFLCSSRNDPEAHHGRCSGPNWSWTITTLLWNEGEKSWHRTWPYISERSENEKKIIKRDGKWPSQHVLPEPDHIQEVFEASPLNQSTPIKKTPVCDEVENPDGPDHDKTEGCSGVEDYESNDPHDTSFHCSDVDWSDDSDEEDIKDDSVPHPAQERKFIVFESYLDQLIGKITYSVCGKPQSDIKKFLLGSMVKVHTECRDGHAIFTWNSQPLLGDMPSGNLLCSAATLFSGENSSTWRTLQISFNWSLLAKQLFLKSSKRYCHLSLIQPSRVTWRKFEKS